MRKIIAVDLDNTLAHYGSNYAIGEPIKGAKEFLLALSEIGDILIYTCRCTKEVSGNNPDLARNKIREWLEKNEMKFDHIYIGQGKPHAHAYVDDRAVSCKPLKDFSAYEFALEDVKELCG